MPRAGSRSTVTVQISPRSRGKKPLPPRIPRLIYEDVTQERLGRALATEWPSGGIFSSEGGAVLGGHSMGKDSIARTLALLNKLWDGAPHVVDRATAASFSVRGARMTISLQVQPHVLADFLDRDRGMSRGSGFLARFLISQPMSLQGTRSYKESGEMPNLGAFTARIAELLSDVPQIDPDRGLVLPMLDFTAEAKAHWISSYNAIESELASTGDFASIRDAASKAADNIARMAAVMHIFEYGPEGRSRSRRSRARAGLCSGMPIAHGRSWPPSPCPKKQPTRRRSIAGLSTAASWRAWTASRRRKRANSTDARGFRRGEVWLLTGGQSRALARTIKVTRSLMARRKRCRMRRSRHRRLGPTGSVER